MSDALEQDTIALLGLGGCWGGRLMIRINAPRLADATGARLAFWEDGGLPDRLLATLVVGVPQSAEIPLLRSARERSRWIVACGDCASNRHVGFSTPLPIDVDLEVRGCPVDLEALVGGMRQLLGR